MPIQIPANATGTLQLIVADAGAPRPPRIGAIRAAPRPQQVAQLIRTFNQRAPQQPPLRAAARPPTPGAVVNGEPMAALPPSVLAVLEADRNSGTTARCAARRAASGSCPSTSPSPARGSSTLPSTNPEPDWIAVIACDCVRSRPVAGASPSFVAAAVASLAVHAAPGFWQAATQADFLSGDVEQLVDRRARPADARPADRACTMPACRSSGRSLPGADGSLFLGTGNDGKVFRVDRNGQGRGVLRQRRAGSARAGAGAGRRAVRRHLARRPHLQGRRRRAQATTFFDPDDKYIWALAVDRAGQRLSPRPATRAWSTRSRRTARARSSSPTKTTHAVVAGVRSPSGSCSSAPARPAACSASTPRARRFLLLDTTSRKCARCASMREGHALRRGAERRAPARRR